MVFRSSNKSVAKRERPDPSQGVHQVTRYKAYACKMYRGSVQYLHSERERITHAFDSAGITEVVTRANDVMMKVENPFREWCLVTDLGHKTLYH